MQVVMTVSHCVQGRQPPTTKDSSLRGRDLVCLKFQVLDRQDSTPTKQISCLREQVGKPSWCRWRSFHTIGHGTRENAIPKTPTVSEWRARNIIVAKEIQLVWNHQRPIVVLMLQICKI